MSLAPVISPLVSSQIPTDIKTKYLSYLTIPELCKAGEVCKEWFKLSRDKVIWTPIFTELNPYANKQFNVNEQEMIQSDVLRYLQQNQKRVDQFISLIENDEQLALFIDNSSLSLADLSKMLPIERTMHVMKGLRKDCTQFLVHLPEKHRRDMDKHLREKYPRADFSGKLFMSIMMEFYERDKSLPCFIELVKDPVGPFNAEEVMSANLTLLEVAWDKVMDVCATIVKSHQNLSSFFKTSIKVRNARRGDFFVPVTTMVFRELIPEMERLGLGVSMDDWIKCGLEMPAAQ